MELAGEKASSERPIIRLVDHIVAEGITSRASDIHLEPEEGGVAVRYRIDGVLRQTMILPRAAGIPLVSRIKIMSGLDIADRLRPQDGRARVAVNGVPVDLRVSTLPASHGEKVVMRILDTRATVLSLDGMGLRPDELERIKGLLQMREGVILVTGPTGSGKTTTLYSALRQIQTRGVNIVTVEDPVEYRLQGIVQVQVNEKAGLTFAAALALDPATGPGRRARRRDPRPRDRGDRGAGVAHGSPRALDAAHDRRRELDHASHRHRRRELQARGRAQGHRRAATPAAAMPAVPGGLDGSRPRAAAPVDSLGDGALSRGGMRQLLADGLPRPHGDRRGAGVEPRSRAAHLGGRKRGPRRGCGSRRGNAVAVGVGCRTCRGGGHHDRRAAPRARGSAGGSRPRREPRDTRGQRLVRHTRRTTARTGIRARHSTRRPQRCQRARTRAFELLDDITAHATTSRLTPRSCSWRTRSRCAACCATCSSARASR